LPVSIAGNAQGVNPDTPVALRYQVDWPASSAKFGYTRLSIRPLASSRELSGNSSNRTITTGGWLPGAAAAGAGADDARAGSTSAEVGEASRNSSANTTGAGVRKRSHSRGQDMAAYSTPASRPATEAITASQGPRRPVVALTTSTASSVHSPVTATRCRWRRTVGLTSPATTSRTQMLSAGSTINPSTSSRMSARPARRNRNMSGLRPTTSSTGWVMASPVSANSSASAQPPSAPTLSTSRVTRPLGSHRRPSPTSRRTDDIR
jgi:hypothetical protein